MKKNVVLIFVFFLLVTLSACRTSQVYNVNNAALAPAIDRPLTIEDVKFAIIRAGGALGWQMEPDAPGHIAGTLTLREHVAMVDINYTTDSYSINYKDSSNFTAVS